jgi:hypothetical protein
MLNPRKAVLLFFITFLPFLAFSQKEKGLLSTIEKYQEKQRLKREVAANHLAELEKGILIIRYKTYRKKLNALERMVQQKPKSKRFKRMLKKTKRKSIALQKATINAYTNYYTFSKIIFMPDTLADKLLTGTRKGIFVDNNLEIDETIELTGNNFYISYIGFTPISTTTGMEALLIVDNKNQLLKAPFPSATRMNILSDSADFATNAEEINKGVKDQQRNLERYKIALDNRK